MWPALRSGDRILASRLACRMAPPARGDIVLFTPPGPVQGHFVKRIVGLPGEHIQLSCRGVLADGHPLKEAYASGPLLPDPSLPRSWYVDEAAYFVLGDHRADSFDSRRFGPVPFDHVVARLWFRYWPWGRRRGRE